MSAEEINEMMTWFTENVENLGFIEQMQVGMAIGECIDKLKPIYIKHASFDDKTTFLFKL